MAKTFDKLPLRIKNADDPYVGYVTRHIPEGASQTYPAGSPVKYASGYVAVFVDPSDAKLFAFSKTAGHNSAAGTDKAEVILAVPGLQWHATFLGAAAANNTLAQTDFGGSFALASAAILPDGSSAWYLLDSAVNPTLVMVDPTSDYGNWRPIEDPTAYAGDINVRVTCMQLAATGLFV